MFRTQTIIYCVIIATSVALIHAVVNTEALQQLEEVNRRLKILIYSPSFAYSHMQFQGRLADLLVDAGHEVHLLMPQANPLLGNYTGVSKGQRVVTVERPLEKRGDFLRTQVLHSAFAGPSNMLLDGSLWDWHHVWVEQCGELIANKELITKLTNENYDAGISEIMHLCAFGIFKMAGVNASLATCAIGLNPKASHHFGIPVIPSWATNLFAPSLDGPWKGFWARATSFYITLFEQIVMHSAITASYQPIFDAAIAAPEEFPSMEEVMRNISLLFVNSNEFFDLPHLTSNKVVHIGGLLDAQAGRLSASEEQILAKSRSGVVLFSFGTLADTKGMPSAMKSAFIDAFAHFPTLNFIWKLSGNDTADHELLSSVSNVHTLHWLQQKALLQHPKLKAFITHCGLNSLSEAAAAGVPVICIPLFGDQPYNAALMRYKKMGVYLDICQTVKPEPIVKALKEVLYNPIYADNARLLARKLERSPFSAAEKFVKWVEFAAEYPDLNELNLPYAELNFLVYYSFDVISASVAVILAISWLIRALWRLAKRSMSRRYRKWESIVARQQGIKIKAS